MNRQLPLRSVLLGATLALGAAAPARAQSASPFAAWSTEPLVANDNRHAGGELKNGLLTLRLEIRPGAWHPEADNGETLPVYAFAEFGRPLQAPAPMIRVPAGTTVDVTVHSTIAVPVTLYGLHQRPGRDAETVVVEPGATQHIRFLAGAPGTYFYKARTPDGAKGNGRGFDALMGGALVVDAPGAPADDRVFVLERWAGATRTAINGKSWPFTERLAYQVGEPVHWRVINASDLSHPMHLHGLHFSVDARSTDGETVSTFAGAERPLVFTETAEVGQTFDMTWTPKEAGRWLFHCHRQPHMRVPVTLDPADVVGQVDDHMQAHEEDSDYAGMGGMIMEITVSGPHHETPPEVWRSARQLELVVSPRNGDARFFQLELREPGQPAPRARANSPLSGPPIVLEQGKPVEIAVVNRLAEATAIHWHGMELESYYDGVPVLGGLDQRQAPSVEPGQTFVARMIPSRAGTFIYHTHWHDDDQLTGGVTGPLIVLPPGQTWDPATDKPFIFTQSPNEPFGAAMLLMNGVPQPNTMQLKTGVKYRFRFINITPSVANLRVSLRRASVPVEWRWLAKDAADLPPSQATMQRADVQVSVGETYDVEVVAAAPGELTLEGIQPNDTRRAVQTIVFTDGAR